MSASDHCGMDLSEASRLSNAELIAACERLARSEREASATLVAHLAVLLDRRLHVRAGHATLFTYCTDVLRLSRNEAYDRMKAAGVARRFPCVLRMLAEREVSLTTLKLIARHITRRNFRELLAAVRGKNRREVELFLAERFPRPDTPTTIHRLPPPAIAPQGALPSPVLVQGTGTPTAELERIVTTLAGVTQSEPRPTVVRPLSPERFHVAFTGDTDLVELIELARDLLSHAIPDRDLSQVLARALRVLIEQLLRQKFAVTDSPRRGGCAHDDLSAYVPAEVKRTVYFRDRGRCTFVGTDGRRCGERAFLEFQHVVPRAVSGPATAENLVLMCAVHNRHEAEVYFGRAMNYGVSEAREGGEPSSWNDKRRSSRWCVSSYGVQESRRVHGRVRWPFTVNSSSRATSGSSRRKTNGSRDASSSAWRREGAVKDEFQRRMTCARTIEPWRPATADARARNA
jgi:hypothetical protein